MSTLEKEEDLLRLQDDSLHSTTDSTTRVLSTLEKEEDLLRLWDDSLHSTTDSTTHVFSTLEKEEDLLRLQDDSLHSTTDSTAHVDTPLVNVLHDDIDDTVNSCSPGSVDISQVSYQITYFFFK